MEFIGEQIIYGHIGHLLIIISFTAALGSALFFFISSGNTATTWKKSARIIFLVHFISAFSIIFLLLFLLIDHRFEYYYVWQHSNSQTPVYYIISSLWEGQEGSFLLWLFWNGLLGIILMYTAKEWEPATMSVVAMVQAFIGSMLLGIYVLGYKIGSNPFVLLREHPDMINMPFTRVPDYLLKIDGRGLNPLLQNYWMLIHPPILFLGFASTLIPFAYAMAALWKKQFLSWQKPALPWVFFGVMTLGGGVLMGGAWAYEALSFGGFWAWDPVENASLVPWLTFVASSHILLINTHRQQSIRLGFAVTILTFILVLYSTFLTRSGILGDTSVHAFTDLGMSGQLIIYLLSFFTVGFFLLLKNWKAIPHITSEEHILSREFWMFVGALVLCISSFQIIFTTSIPVINKVFGTTFAPPVNAIAHYNAWQVPFAIIVTIVIAFTLFLKYKETASGEFFKKIVFSFLAALVFASVLVFTLEISFIPHILLLFSSIFAIAANADYFVRIKKATLLKSGSAIAHLGMGLIILGALISASKNNIISSNTSGMDISALGKDFSNKENILLLKGDTLRMGNYYVVYSGKEKSGFMVFFHIDFLYTDENGKITKAFSLAPKVQLNARMGNVAEPDTKHFLTHDIYTHVTYADLSEQKQDSNGYENPSDHVVGLNDTVFYSNGLMVPAALYNVWDTAGVSQSGPVAEWGKTIRNKIITAIPPDSVEIAASVRVKIVDVHGKEFSANPVLVVKKSGEVNYIDDEIPEAGLRINFFRLFPETKKIQFKISEKASSRKDFIILKAIVFPYINILWTGAVLLVIGCLITVIKRIKKLRDERERLNT